MLIIKDSTFKEVQTFLEQCDKHGRKIPAVIANFEEMGVEPRTVSAEARMLKGIFLKLRQTW